MALHLVGVRVAYMRPDNLEANCKMWSRATHAQVDSHETSKQVGVDVYMGTSTFTGKNELQVGEKRLKFRKAVIATGGRAKVPPIPGLGSN